MRSHATCKRSVLRAPRAGAIAAAIVAILAVASAGGCAPMAGREYSPEEKALMRLQTAGSVWWTGNGSHAVLQAVGEDGKPTVEVWERATGKRRTFEHYRAVDVEPHAARIWLVPDDRPVPLGVNPDTADPRIIDIAGDGADSLPSELYAVDLAKDGEPRADIDARWTTWEGEAGYSAYVEIDINKGACPSTLRFSATGGSLNAWSAKVPTDVVTFEPIGWSPSGEYFAVISQAEESATVRIADEWVKANASAEAEAAPGTPVAKPPTWQADIVIFSAANGAVTARQQVTAPVLVPNAGANIAAWGAEDLLWYFDAVSGTPSLAAMGTSGPIDLVLPKLGSAADRRDRGWMAGSYGGRPVAALLSAGEAPDGSIRLVAVGADKARALGNVKGTATARSSAKAGFISLQPYSAKEMGWIVYRTDKPGGRQTEIFAVGGPIEPVRAE